MARSLLRQFKAGLISDDYFEKRPYEAIHLQRVKEIDHDSAKVRAIVLRHSDGRYEVRYFVYEPVAQSMGGRIVHWDWVRTRRNIATFATDLQSAEEVAKLELEQIWQEELGKWE